MVTYLLIAVNVLVYIVELSQGGSENALTLYLLGALNPAAVLNGKWWRLLTSMFLHAGLIHIMFNMYILYQVGRFMEYALGALRYSLLFDLSTPQVSFPAHFGGLVTGFFLGILLQTGRSFPWTRPQTERPDSLPGYNQ